jgi:hypothetical protein
MDPEGWIPVELLAGFKRMRALTTSLPLVREMLGVSALAELDASADRVRMGSGRWQPFVLPPTAPEPAHAVSPGAPRGKSADDDEEVDVVVHDGVTHAGTPALAA